ncbi:DUF1177 family protein [Streptomyces sp. KL116D]|uniref:DUF1177 family protein n=1 Tax=Streptomyces sp. KL116D TaxID=3045152 RepID=UPI003557DA42
MTPYGNGAHHITSILQPATATAAPVAACGHSGRRGRLPTGSSQPRDDIAAAASGPAVR